MCIRDSALRKAGICLRAGSLLKRVRGEKFFKKNLQRHGGGIVWENHNNPRAGNSDKRFSSRCGSLYFSTSNGFAKDVYKRQITRYEVRPATGVRLNRIASLEDDIALGIRAQKVRIIAPIPGQGTVGIEVPNKHRSMVRVRDIIESREWNESLSLIHICVPMSRLIAM